MNSALQLAEHPLVGALGWTLLHFVWQGAAIGLITYLILRGGRPALASTRYLVGVAALGLIVAAPMATFVSTVQQQQIASVNWPATAGSSPSLVTGSIIAEMAANPAATRQLMPPGNGSLRPIVEPPVVP